MTTYDTLSLMMQFGLYTLALLTLVVAIVVALHTMKGKKEE
ncbi:MAG TPA: putative holin-like toxin [Bacilli bacterium]|nr:putative holin-like toxin [Bacilli bacterium]